jgi:hypothetical protein
MRFVVMAVLAFALLDPSSAEAQNSQTRSGFWFNGGLGWGSLGCEDCGSRETGFSGNLAIGGTVSQQLLLGVGTNGWTKTVEGVTLTAGALTGQARYYTSPTGGFYLLAGLGVSSLDLSIPGWGNYSERGAAAVLGLGYDIRVGSNVSISPFWNGVGISTNDSDANFGQIGFGLTIH